MRSSASTLLLLSLIVGVAFECDAFAERESEYRNSIEKTFSGAIKEILEITDAGPATAELHLPRKDGSVFLLNATKDSLLSYEIDFGKKQLHCWSKNLKPQGNGIVRTVQPVGPKDFAILCFPEKGAYPVRILGLKGNPEGVSTKVIVD